MADDTAMMPIAVTRVEVAAQPEVIARVLHDLEAAVNGLAQKLSDRSIHTVLASGSGDSWFAAQAVQLAWERYAGVRFDALQAYEYAAYGREGENAQYAHFIISSSGRPTTTWDALDRALASPAYVIGVTDNRSPDNPFVTRPDETLIPGAMKAGWPAQTTTATIAVLLKLAVEFGRKRGFLAEGEATRLAQELAALPAKMEEVLRMSNEWAVELADRLQGKRLYYLVGGGPNYAVAQTGSALLAEGPQEVGLALPVEEFHHGLRIATIRAGEPVILIAPAGAAEPRCRDTARSVRQWGAHLIALVTDDTADILAGPGDGIMLPDVPEPFSPLLSLLPLHALSIALAARKVAAGYQRPESVP